MMVIFSFCLLPVCEADFPFDQPVEAENDGLETPDNEAIYKYTLEMQNIAVQEVRVLAYQP